MPKRNRLYIFEGVDGAGKSAISTAFADGLLRKGLVVRHLAFPGNTPETLGHLVYQIHHDPKDFGVGLLAPASLQALHIAAHLDAIESVIIPALRNGEVVVLDRFWWSTLAYGTLAGASRRILDALIEVERKAWGPWRPSRVFYVSRRAPLRPEPLQEWKKLKAIYQKIISVERVRYPVHIIKNEATVSSAARIALSLAIT
jgi:thymidylate kinase